MPDRVYLDQNYGLHYPPDAKHIDGASEDVLLSVHEHWHQFPPIHPMYQHFISFIFFFLWFFSVIGNGLVIYIFLKTKSLRTPSNMLVVALALSDMIMMITQVPPVVINAFISRYWCWGPVLCDVYGFTGGLFGVASLWLIIFIGYDRYNVIVKGISGTKVTPLKAFLMIIFSFVMGAAIGIPPLIKVWGAYSLEGLLLTCSFDYLTDTLSNQMYCITIFSFDYVIPMCFVIFFYSQIVIAVVSHEKALKAQAKKMNVDSLRSNQDGNKESAEMRIAKVAITNVSIWVISWTPYAITVMTAAFITRAHLTPLLTQMPSLLAKSASGFNPLVYAINHPKYREALSKEFPCLGVKEAGDNSDTKTTNETN